MTVIGTLRTGYNHLEASVKSYIELEAQGEAEARSRHEWFTRSNVLEMIAISGVIAVVSTVALTQFALLAALIPAGCVAGVKISLVSIWAVSVWVGLVAAVFLLPISIYENVGRARLTPSLEAAYQGLQRERRELEDRAKQTQDAIGLCNEIRAEVIAAFSPHGDVTDRRRLLENALQKHRALDTLVTNHAFLRDLGSHLHTITITSIEQQLRALPY